MRVGFDIDGVLADFVKGYTNAMNRLHGTDYVVPVEGVPSWDWDAEVWSKPERDHFWRTVGVSDEFWINLHPLPDLYRTFDLLQKLPASTSIWFISNRPVVVEDASRYWLANNLLIGLPKVIHTKKKGMACDALGLDVFFDDRPENLVDIKRFCGGSCEAFLIDQSYNRSFSSPYIHRVESVKEGLDKVMGVEV